MSPNVEMGPDEKVVYRQTSVNYISGLKSATVNLLITDQRLILVRSEASGLVESLMGQKDVLLDIPVSEITGWTNGKLLLAQTLEIATSSSGVIKLTGVKMDRIKPFLPTPA